MISKFFFGGMYMQEFILFIMTFISVYIIYQLFVVLKYKRKKDNKNYKEPFEVLYLRRKYNLDMKKINFKTLLQVISLVSSFDIALIVSIISHIKNVYLQLLCGFVLILVFILLSYHVVYLIYKRKDLIIDERNK
jgi:hypothetical protein